MTWFTVEPRDLMIVRDGRAMNGSSARSLPVPPLSTLAGLVRTRLGRGTDGVFDQTRIAELLQVQVGGPLLAELSADGEAVDEVLCPAPSDAIWFEAAVADPVGQAAPPRLAAWRLVAKSLSEIAAGATSDLGSEVRLPTFAGGAPQAKAALGPAWWRWSALREWLLRPPVELPWSRTPDEVGGADPNNDPRPDPAAAGARSPAEVGGPELVAERRTHVSIDPVRGTASDGALFQIEGRRFAAFEGGRGARRVTRLAVLTRVRGGGDAALAQGLVTLGGERGSAFLRAARGTDLAFPPGLDDRLRAGTTARVVLLTPASFPEGSVPTTVRGARVVAAKVGRPEVCSGWDYSAPRGGCPKPTRRFVPAGTVYWVTVPSDDWARETWLEPVGPRLDERADEHGLAVVGTA